MNEPAVVRLSATEARRLTEEVKADAAALWAKLLSLYEGGAHTVLGYTSWGAYYEAEFGQTPSRGYQLLRAARVSEALAAGDECTVVHSLPNEAQARAVGRSRTQRSGPPSGEKSRASPTKSPRTQSRVPVSIANWSAVLKQRAPLR